MPSKPRRGIQNQILMIAAVPALIVTVILIVVIYRGNIGEGDRALDRQGQLLADQLAANLEYALSAGAIDQIPDTVSSNVDPAVEVLGTGACRVVVLNRDDQPVFSTPTVEAAAVAVMNDPMAWLVSAKEVKSFTAPIYLKPVDTGLFDEATEKRYLGKVIIEVPTAPIKLSQIKNLLRDLGLVTMTFGIALGLAYWIGRRLSGAIKEAADAIMRIKTGDLSVRLTKTESSEIGTLQEGVNLAVEAIVRGKDALEAALAKVRAEHEVALSQLRIQTEAAQRANQAKSMFLAKVSHEMRTPLYSIQGLGEQLLKTPRNSDDAHTLRNILRASKTLYHTISDILDFTQLEGGKYQPASKPFDLWEEIETSTETVGSLAAEQDLYLDVMVAPDVPPVVLGDQRGFRTIVANLLSNAVKFTPQGGVCIRLALAAQRPDRTAMIKLQVQDTGHGIPQNRRLTIFEPFEQLDEGLNRRYAGSGLGLSIVKNYCDAMEGRIAVDSEPGNGSTFTVLLPVKVHPASLGRVNGAEFSRLTALVVDERPSFCESLESRLSSLGVAVSQRLATAQVLMAQALSPRRFDLMAIRDLSLADSPVEIIQRLGAWAEHLMSFETGTDNERFQTLRDQGVAAVLWSAATRDAIAAALRTIYGNDQTETTDFPLGDLDDTRINRRDLEGKRVLVAEDFEMNREIMSRQLRNHGLRVVEARDGNEAIALGLQPGIDLILMDIQMPHRDGLSAIQAIRQQAEGQRIPIIGFTASADQPTHRRVLAAGSDRVLTKPISEAELISAVHHLIARSP